MSWADDIRCLYCDGRLPLYRKITNGQFCNSAHRKAYWAEQERLGVERLLQTHDSLRAYRPAAGGVEAILGQASLQPENAAEAAAAEPRPWWMPQVNAGQVPMGALLPNPMPKQPRWLEDHVAGGNPEPLAAAQALRRPVNLHRSADCVFDPAGRVDLELAGAHAPESKEHTDLAPLEISIPPITRFVLTIASRMDEPTWLVEEVPAIETMMRISGPQPKEPQPVEAAAAAPIETVVDTHLPRNAHAASVAELPANETTVKIPEPHVAEPVRVEAVGAEPLEAAPSRHLPLHATHELAAAIAESAMTALPLNVVAKAPASDAKAIAEAFEPRVEAPVCPLATPPPVPELNLAAGSRYAVAGRGAGSFFATAGPELVPETLPAVSLPSRDVKILRAAASASTSDRETPEPRPSGMLPLAGLAKPTHANFEIKIATAGIPQPLRTEVMHPASNLEPLDAKPVADLLTPPVVLPETAAPEAVKVEAPVAAAPPAPAEAAIPEPPRVHLYTHAIDFWNHAPRDLKILMFAIPILIGLALHPPLPKVRVSAPAAGAVQDTDFQKVLNQELGTVRKQMVDRAAIALDEDFRSGLDDWMSRGDATAAWSFDGNGFVKPGPLALYRPSLGLTDYQLQFLGLIDKQAISWVVRAADFENYYVVKLVVLKGGPLPRIGLTRYAVVNGKADARADTVVPIDARSDMLYRVNLDVHGTDYALLVQGQMVDSWSEPRLRRGGVGFFSARGEASRLRWVQVTHQYDMLGKLCAYLAPYNIPTTSGSWQQ